MAAPADSGRVTAVTAAWVAAPGTAAIIAEMVLAQLANAPCGGHGQIGGSLPRVAAAANSSCEAMHVYGPTESEALTLDFVPDAQLADRFRLALDMYEFGEKMTQSRLRRDHPGAPTSRSRGCSGTGARNGLGHQAGMPRGGRPVSSGEPSRSRAAAPCIGLATAPSLLGACRWLCRVSPGRATIHP